MIRRFFIAFAVGFVCMFGATVSYACTSDEIDVLGDGTNCQTTKFTLTTTEIADGGKFQFYMSAMGTFYVDCGAGGTLSSSASDVSGVTITRSNTTGATYTCTYTGNTNTKKIRFGGIASTGSAYVSGTNANAAAIRFNVTPTLVASISGSLGALFPSRGTASAQQPRFYRTFYGCTNLTNIPADLFSGVTGTATYMFYQTFYNCSGLTGYIPAGLFDKITTYSTSMMTNMFYGTGLDTTCSGTTVQYITGFEGYWSSKVSCTEPFVTPVVLDGQSATTTSVPTTVYLKYGTGWYSDLNATTPISARATNPTKTDYDFEGDWTATDGAGTQIIDNDGNFLTTDAILRLAKITDASKTIYANWTQDYTVTYDCGDGTGTPPANGTATSRKTFNIAANTCSRNGYMFVGWLVSGTSDVQSESLTWDYTESKTFTAQWVEPKFTIITTNVDANTSFGFAVTARGTFYVDWGDGFGRTISKTSTANGTYSHTYASGGVYTVRFAGLATAYSTGNNDSTVKFNNTAIIAELSGSIGAIFPTLSGASSKSTDPRFSGTFGSAKALTSLSGTLFNGVTRPGEKSFLNTFSGCSGLTSIPEDLFSTVRGTPAWGTYYATFYYCTGLTEIPENLFSGLSGAPAAYLFKDTFYGCRGLTGSIPENLFSGIQGAPSEYMFEQTFFDCSGLTGPIPARLFSGIQGAPAYSMFFYTFSGCSGLTGSIPSGLFSGISGAPASNMFYLTFKDCTGLTGSIPSGLFSGISGAPASNMFNGTFSGCSGLTGSIPENLFSGIYGGAGAGGAFSNTFSGCSNLSGYVPKGLFENITSSTGVTTPFTNTNLYTECPCGTKPATTGWGATVVDGRAVCEVGTKDNEHWNNGVCTTDCNSTFTRLKTSTGLAYPLLASNTSEMNINIGMPLLDVSIAGTSYCYRSLYGNGTNGSCSSDTVNYLGASTSNKSGKWGVVFPYGDVSGTSVCSYLNGGTMGVAANAEQAEILDAEYLAQAGTGSAASTKKYCWCKMENPFASQWLYKQSTTSVSLCRQNCAQWCSSSGVQTSSSYRRTMFYGICHVPLANGAANNAINASFGGATYHATVPDEIMPTGFTGQPAPAEPE